MFQLESSGCVCVCVESGLSIFYDVTITNEEATGIADYLLTCGRFALTVNNFSLHFHVFTCIVSALGLLLVLPKIRFNLTNDELCFTEETHTSLYMSVRCLQYSLSLHGVTAFGG